ncbi:MAG: nonstructural protein [Microvirus sp.]|nr:MAG: nonstructural protein [Microvirus sp.]
MSVHYVYAVRDVCVDTWLLPWFFQNSAAAVRALGDTVNKPSEDNMFYQHPEHYQLYAIGTFDDSTGRLDPVVPVFVVDCQSLVRDANSVKGRAATGLPARSALDSGPEL